jgi:hypothetical protein
MICFPCRQRRHTQCPGGTWCCCQHQPGQATPDQQPTGTDVADLADVAGVRELVEASSLGTPGARALRARTSPETRWQIAERAAGDSHPDSQEGPEPSPAADRLDDHSPPSTEGEA